MKSRVIVAMRNESDREPENKNEVQVKAGSHSVRVTLDSDILRNPPSEEVLERVEPFVCSIKQGFNAAVLAFDTHQSGKGVEMTKEQGAIQLSIESILLSVLKTPIKVQSVLVSGDNVYDLLKEGPLASVYINEKSSNYLMLDNLSEQGVTSLNKCLELFRQAVQKYERYKRPSHFIFNLRFRNLVEDPRLYPNLTFCVIAGDTGDLATLRRVMYERGIRHKEVSAQHALVRIMKNPLSQSCYTCFFTSITDQSDAEIQIEVLRIIGLAMFLKYDYKPVTPREEKMWEIRLWPSDLHEPIVGDEEQPRFFFPTLSDHDQLRKLLHSEIEDSKIEPQPPRCDITIINAPFDFKPLDKPSIEILQWADGTHPIKLKSQTPNLHSAPSGQDMSHPGQQAEEERKGLKTASYQLSERLPEKGNKTRGRSMNKDLKKVHRIASGGPNPEKLMEVEAKHAKEKAERNRLFSSGRC